MTVYRRDADGSRTNLSDYHLEAWYRIGAERPANAWEMGMALADGSECYRAFMAGVMARLFGVSLHSCVLDV